jgi:hypothetical protein
MIARGPHFEDTWYLPVLDLGSFGQLQPEK